MNAGLPPRSAVLVWSVTALVQAVGDALGARFGAVAVRGELGSVTRASSGHCYFMLKAGDGSAALRCAMFRRAAMLLDFEPRDGQEVELRGRLAVFEPRGELQLIVESMRRGGAGALMEQFLRLKARLEAEGLFDSARKRAISAYPRRLGIVTSLGAAALHDVLSALARRAPQVELIVYPAAVQGADAPAQLVRSLQLAARRAEVDTLLLCRGGGSLEDLWAFNDERVVRAIAASPMPVISGVGHETDITLADFAADLRAPTPTAAAELAATPRAECLNRLDQLAQQFDRRTAQRLEREAQRLDRAMLRLARPGDVLHRQRQRLQMLQQRQTQVLPALLARQREQLDRLALQLHDSQRHQRLLRAQRLALLEARWRALDPHAVLARGYALLTDAQGRPVMSVAQAAPGQALQAALADGQLQVQVTAVQKT
ncbi:MAG: exodeoxyribonuclease VII large subunit [Leptothrix sp. (in: b-proteobacteria)]